nr:PREDICTED: facilitated trehalose transporter Tret1-like isoform X3 [Bemisia tabaci]
MFKSSWLQQNEGYARQLLVCCSVSILPFVYGLLEMWPSLSIERVLDGAAGFPVSEAEISVIVTMPTLAEAITPLALGFVLVNVGRKTNLLLNAIVYILAWVLITFAECPLYLVVAHFIAGFGSAIVLIIGPIFLSEIADKSNRGALVSIYITAVSVGQIFFTGIGIYISYYVLNWIALVLAVLALLCLVAFVTESPYWFMIRRNDKKAEESFRYYRNPTAGEGEEQVKAALAEVRATVETEMLSASSYREMFGNPSNIQASIIVIALSIFQGACGIIAILTYASTTLPKYDGFWQPNPTIAVVSILNLVTNIISVGLIDTLGRKPLTILSNGGNALGTAIVAFYYVIDEYTDYDTTDIKWVPYVGLLVFISFYGLAMATIPHLLAGELFPANVRYQANVISTICFAGSCAFFNYIYLGVCHSVGVSVMFGLFTFFNVAATIFSCVYVFETKNLTLAEIQLLAAGKAQQRGAA